MTLKQYQKEAKRTMPDLDSSMNMLHMRMGVVTEIGEFVDQIKKHLIYKKPLDVVNLGEEVADIMWYLVNEMTLTGEVAFDDSSITSTKNIDLVESVDSILKFQEMYLYKGEEYTYANLIRELMYITSELHLDFDVILQNNINKLKIRFPDKFSEDLAINRNLTLERIELEKN